MASWAITNDVPPAAPATVGEPVSANTTNAGARATTPNLMVLYSPQHISF